jgi:hypothetical protein
MSDDVVVKTIEDPAGGRRVRIYRRPNGTFGFDEWVYWPDEDSWCPSVPDSYAVIDTAERAEQEARSRISWLRSN